MALRGTRGAITVQKNKAAEIIYATKELLQKMVAANSIKIKDIAAVVFSATIDLNAEFPALGARQLGWLYTPLLCTHEMKVKKGLKKCIRVLILFNSEVEQAKIKNIYLKGAKTLRPDLGGPEKDLYYFSE